MSGWLPVLAVTATLFAVAMLGLGLGAMAGRRCLRGSCGGTDARTSDGPSLRCAVCPNRRRARAKDDAGA